MTHRSTKLDFILRWFRDCHKCVSEILNGKTISLKIQTTSQVSKFPLEALAWAPPRGQKPGVLFQKLQKNVESALEISINLVIAISTSEHFC